MPRGHAFNPFPRSLADCEHAGIAVQDHILACRFGIFFTQQRGQNVPAVFSCVTRRWQLVANNRRSRREQVHQVHHFIADRSRRNLARPACDERHAETTFIDVLFAAAPGSVYCETGIHRLGFRSFGIAEFDDTSIVAGEDDERVVGETVHGQCIEHAAYAAVQLMNPVAKLSCGA